MPKKLFETLKHFSKLKKINKVGKEWLHTRPSAPNLPLPVIRKTISTSHHLKFVLDLVQIAPFWLFKDGAILTLSDEAMASKKLIMKT